MILKNDKHTGCKYFDCSDFKSSFNDFNGIFSFHINIGSLQKHVDSLKALLEETEFNFDVIAITETRIKFDGNLITLELTTIPAF